MARPETGAMKFEGDWRGVFIRGDNAAGYLSYIRMVQADPRHAHLLNGLARLLESSDERNEGVETQQMKPYDECAANAAR